MTRKIKTFGLLLFLTVGQIAFGQTKKEKALERGNEAVELMDNGKIDESIKLLEEAQKLDPENYHYPYEMAYAYYLKKDYKQAIKILEKISKHKDITENYFQLLGNSYDMIENPNKAIEVYDTGLKKIPNSGKMYLEKGNIYFGKKEYLEALTYYEKGIEVNPKFSSNYYRAARIYCGSSESVWGLLYGEIFMNLERNSKRTAEISKLLYDTYKNNIKIWANGDSSKIDFCRVILTAENILDKDNIKLPFCAIFGQDFIMSIIEAKTIDINSLDKIRNSFINNYFNNGHDTNYPNALFNYQKQIKDAGHIEAYSHWILMKGDEDGFDKWQSDNKEKWDNFIKWFTDNSIKIDEKNKFFRGQY